MTTTLLFAAMTLWSTAHAFEFDVDPLLRGARTALRVSGADSGHYIEIVRSSRPPVPDASCPAALGGACLDLVAPARVATLEVSALGVASVHPIVPSTLALQDVWFQAIDRNTGEKSPVVQGRVMNVCSGDLRTDLPNQRAVLSQCGELRGDLIWRPVDGVLPALPWLHKVRGTLLVQPGPTATQIVGPPRLEHVSGLIVEDAPMLEQITGFETLRVVQRLTLDNVGALGRNDLFTGSAEPFVLKLRELPWLGSLTQLGPLPPLLGLDLRGIDVVDLSGMHPAGVEVFDLTLSEMEVLESLEGLSPPIGELTMTLNDLPVLSDLSALQGAVTSEFVLVYESPAITDFEGLEGLVSLGYLYVVGSEGVTTLEHLRGALGPDTTEVALWGMPSLESLAGLEGLSTLRNLTLAELPLVPSLAPFAALTEVAGLLELERLDALASLDGLQALRELVGLELNENASLSDVSALAGLASLQRAEVRFNPMLCEDDVLTALGGVSIPHGLTLGGNGACP